MTVLNLEEFVRRGKAAQAAVNAGTELPLLPGASLTALVLPEGLSYEEWARVGHALGRLVKGTPWWVADFLRYGERRWGEKYAQAAGELGLHPETLRNYQWVGSQFADLSRRHDKLSFSHHAEVAALDGPTQEQALDKAEAEGWSARDLREHVRALKPPPVVKPDLTEPAKVLDKALQRRAQAVIEYAEAITAPADAATLARGLEPEDRKTVLTALRAVNRYFGQFQRSAGAKGKKKGRR